MSKPKQLGQQSIKRIKVFRDGTTWFVRDGGFSLPFQDDELRFNLDAAMLSIGGRKIQEREWNVPLNAIDVHDYLVFLSKSSQREDIARKQWVRKFVLTKQNQELGIPFIGESIDWKTLASLVNTEVSKQFPLCV